MVVWIYNIIYYVNKIYTDIAFRYISIRLCQILTWVTFRHIQAKFLRIFIAKLTICSVHTNTLCLPHLRQQNHKHSYPYPEGPNKLISKPLFSISFSLVPLSYSHIVSQWSAVWLCMVTCKWSMRWTSVSPDLRNVVQCPALMPDRQEHTQVHLTQFHLSDTEADKPETNNQSATKWFLRWLLSRNHKNQYCVQSKYNF